MLFILYYGEMVFAPLLALGLLVVHDTFTIWDATWTFLGYAFYTFAEYFVHRVVLHHWAPSQHHAHHAHPFNRIYMINWGVWALMMLVGSLFGSMFVVGALLGYGWYLFLHQCAHHQRLWMSETLRRHHDFHHKMARFNFGLSTVFWDEIFKTRLG